MEEEVRRLRTVLSLMDLGVRRYRRRLAEEHPEDSAEQLERRLRLWLVHRPGHFTSRFDDREVKEGA